MDGINPYNGGGNPANGANGDGYGGTPVTGGMPAFPGSNGPDMSGPGSAGAPGSEGSKTTLWMGELEPWMDENFVKGVFITATSEQVNVKVIRDKNSGNAGYCFVEFASSEAASKALNLNGTPVPNSARMFKLNWASGGGINDRR